MKKISLLLMFALAAGFGPVSAQMVNGRVINSPIFDPYSDPSRILTFAQTDNIFGTSRTTAMGGAFTSLGADLSSMSINPAGLGMYQSSDWGFTQALSINASKADVVNLGSSSFSSGGNRTSYGLNNVAIAFNVFNRSSGVTSLTLGFGYNRTANFNSRSFINTSGEATSIAEMFAQQLNFMVRDRVDPANFDTSNYPFENGDIRFNEWGAVLGYNTGLVGENAGGVFNWDGISGRADSYFQSVTKGGIYDYNISAGLNVGNFLYLGATLDVSQIDYSEENSYEEAYPLNSTGLGEMWYDQNTRINGSGVSMKLGTIVRPFPALRIGVAFHLPTYYTIGRSYESSMSAGRGGPYYANFTEDPKPMFNTAPKLLAGVSYVFGGKAILALDYERAWYNKMRVRSVNTRDIEDSKAKSTEFYKPGNTFRAGLEILATDIISLRAGGTYMMDFMRDKSAIMSNPTVKSSWSVSGGLGFNIGRNSYIDLSYTYQRANYTDYELFYFDDGINLVSQYDDQNPDAPARYYTPLKNLHQITLTFGSRF